MALHPGQALDVGQHMALPQGGASGERAQGTSCGVEHSLQRGCPLRWVSPMGGKAQTPPAVHTVFTGTARSTSPVTEGDGLRAPGDPGEIQVVTEPSFPRSPEGHHLREFPGEGGDRQDPPFRRGH